MIKSLRNKAKRRLRNLSDSNNIYNNMDFDFQKGQPTAENVKYHLSTTAGTFVPYKRIDRARDLCFVKELHSTSRYNRLAMNVIQPQVDHILPEKEDPSAPKALTSYFTWFC